MNKTLGIIVFCLVLGVTANAHALVMTDFFLLDNNFQVGPDGVIEVPMRLINTSTDGSIINHNTIYFGAAIWFAGSGGYYELNFGPDDARSLFPFYFDLNLAPQQSIDFIAMSAAPRFTAPDGIYFSVFSIGFHDGDGLGQTLNSCIKWTVGNGSEPVERVPPPECQEFINAPVPLRHTGVVPEPATILLLSAGLLGLYQKRNREEGKGQA